MMARQEAFGKKPRCSARVAGAGDQQSQRTRHDTEFDRQASERLAVHLRVNRFVVDRLADQAIGLPEIDAFFLAQIAHPQSWQVAEIFQAALRGEAEKFE